MRRVLDGNNSDSTAATQAFLDATVNPIIRDLIIIGEPSDPHSLWMTNHEAPVLYPPYGTFYPATFTRDGVKVQIGLDSQSMSIDWSPGASAQISATVNTATASPYQLARQHFYDNWPVLILRCFMPTPGDAITLGCTIWWGGRIHTAAPGRNGIKFDCKDYLDVLDQKVPTAVVEVTNSLASTAAVTLPVGDTSVPVFECVTTDSTDTFIVADCTGPTSGKIYSGNEFAAGYMVFLSGPGATLAGVWAAIGQNGEFTDGGGTHHSEFEIYNPLPWPPTPGVDTFYVSKTPPINAGDPDSYPFPYVPAPQTAA